MENKTDLAKLHNQIHQRPSRISIANIRSLLQKICDGDIGKESLVQGSLSCAQVDIDVHFNLFHGSALIPSVI